MSKTLIALYDKFYTPPEMARAKVEIEEAHQLLIERLDKPERKLVLKIIDGKDRIAEDLSEDSFISGFLLAWTLANELNQYKNEHSVPRTNTKDQGAHFISQNADLE